jgi:uncharacterized membrane protein (UPF0182 family)
MNDSRRGVVDWPPPRRKAPRIGRVLLIVALAAIVFGGGTALSYYVDVLWYGSLGYVDVLWTTVHVQATAFTGFAGSTFLVLYLSFLAIKPAHMGELTRVPILINGQPIKLPVEPVLRLIVIVGSGVIAAITGASMAAEWTTLALYWYGRPAAAQLASAQAVIDPIFGRPLGFYLFTLPAWELLSSWLLSLAVLVSAIAGFFVLATGGARMLTRSRDGEGAASLRALSIAGAAVLLTLAVRVYLGRFEQLFDDRGGAIFSGVAYTDAHVSLTGALVVAVALLVGAGIALVNAVAAPKLRWLVAAVVPAAACYAVVGVLGWYVNSFIVKPNELVRETPYIAHNIAFTRRAYALDRVAQQPFPAEAGIEAVDVAHHQATIQNIRLWDWRALQDTLRQIQEIRTYYDFIDIDIDRYDVDGVVRQMMVAARELNIEKLPASSRNWINEKLIYTHGYGVTMNPVNGFTPEGLPTLVLSNMPIQSTIPSLAVSRPEIYFGQLTNTDVYVKTRQKEFNYPQGETNNLTSYEGNGGIALGGFLRKFLIALDRGDVAKLPFSDDITGESRLLMRRNIRERIETLAPFITFDGDPYIVVREDGRLSWIIDGFTTSASFPYARHYSLGADRINYIRNSVKAVVDAYDGTTTFYVFDTEDPIIAAYRGVFPTLFKDAGGMPADLRKHVRYPELLLKMQAAVYGLYHMTEPGVFYNREDLWSVASEVGLNSQREQATQPMEPNFVLMTLPGETKSEFIEILPFTPANRNNLIGWIAGRSDGGAYGTAIVYDFPKTRLVDGPLQIEARIDQNAQISGQLSLWNQQGSHVRRGAMIVIPVGRALLYAESIYLQAERSPMPELRLVVLALQDRLAYGPTFEAALASLFDNVPSSLTAQSGSAQPRTEPSAAPTRAAGAAASPTGTTGMDTGALIAEAARDLADYQRLTAEGKLGEAGQKLEALKRALDQLALGRR